MCKLCAHRWGCRTIWYHTRWHRRCWEKNQEWEENTQQTHNEKHANDDDIESKPIFYDVAQEYDEEEGEEEKDGEEEAAEEEEEEDDVDDDVTDPTYKPGMDMLDFHFDD